MIIDHNHPKYRDKWLRQGANRYNGAFYYSKEIVKNIIPNVDTERNWITINVEGECLDHSIVFIHNNLHPERYNWLGEYKDLILVCGVPATCEKVKHLGKPIYLPLSVDTEYLNQFKREKDKDTAYVGRPYKRKGINLPPGTTYLENMDRPKLLREVARYRNIYGVGRVAIESKYLGANILPYDPRYPDVEMWQVLDNLDAAKMLDKMLQEADNVNKGMGARP